MKELSVKIELTESDTISDVSSLFFAIMEVCGDNFFSVKGADVDGKEIFSIENGANFIFFGRDSRE